MLDAYKNKEVIMGIKGPSPMVAVENFDHVNGYVLDYMHNMLLGKF